jgi:hypothetical protein
VSALPPTLSQIIRYPVATVEFSPDQFLDEVLTTKRYWDGVARMAYPPSWSILLKPAVILIRRDGWSIACDREDFEEVYNFYAPDWALLVFMEPDN